VQGAAGMVMHPSVAARMHEHIGKLSE